MLLNVLTMHRIAPAMKNNRPKMSKVEIKKIHGLGLFIKVCIIVIFCHFCFFILVECLYREKLVPK